MAEGRRGRRAWVRRVGAAIAVTEHYQLGPDRMRAVIVGRRALRSLQRELEAADAIVALARSAKYPCTCIAIGIETCLGCRMRAALAELAALRAAEETSGQGPAAEPEGERLPRRPEGE